MAKDSALQVEEVDAEEQELGRAAREREAIRAERLAKLKAAAIEGVETLYQYIFDKDTEIAKLKPLPGFQLILDEYAEKFSTISEEYMENALEVSKRMDYDRKQFEQAKEVLCASYDQAAIKKVDTYLKRQKHVLRAAYESDEGADSAEGSLEALHSEADELRQQLLTAEIGQNEQVAELVDMFDTSWREFKAKLLETNQKLFRAVEELEGEYFTATQALVEGLMAQVADEEDETELHMDEETVAWLHERDSVMGAVQSSHDIHVGNILKREDAMSKAQNDRFTNAVDGARVDERERNRKRVVELTRMHERHTGAIQRARRDLYGSLGGSTHEDM
jgi:hypothetical protein